MRNLRRLIDSFCLVENGFMVNFVLAEWFVGVLRG